jgi:hypothetical protein
LIALGRTVGTTALLRREQICNTLLASPMDEIPPVSTVDAEIGALRGRRNATAFWAGCICALGVFLVAAGFAGGKDAWQLYVKLAGGGSSAAGLWPLNSFLKWSRKLHLCLDFRSQVAAWHVSPSSVNESTLRAIARMFWASYETGWKE